MVRAIEGRVPAARAGRETVGFEARTHVVARRFERHVDAPAKVVLDGGAVPGEARHDLDSARPGERAAVLHRNTHARQPLRTAGRKPQAFGLRTQSGRVRDRGHLDRGLRAVDERIEHPGIESLSGGLVGGETVALPHRLGRRTVVGGEVFRSLPCAHDFEPACSRPVDELAHERRLVAVGEAVDDSGRPGALGQGRPHECIGLHRHHHDVGAAAYSRQRVLDPRDGGARGLDDHVGARCLDQVDRIVGDGDGSRPLGEIERAAGAIRRASRPRPRGRCREGVAAGRGASFRRFRRRSG